MSSVSSHNNFLPHVIAAEEDDGSVGSNSTGTTPNVSQCPAFSSGSCPFRDVKTPEEVRATLAKMPPSHFQRHLKVAAGNHYAKWIEQLHGGVSPDRRPDTARMLETVSLAAIMSAEMEKLYGKEEEEEEEMDEKEDSEDAAVASFQADEPIIAGGSPTLSQSLKTGTAVSHQAAEDVHFVKNFIAGRIDRDLYATLVRQLYQVYAVLEQVLDAHAAQHFPSCHFPVELARTKALEADVDFWHDSKTDLPVSVATQEYMDRLRDLSTTDPLLLLAHSYTRYLGDLSGGRILRRVAKRALGLDGEGLDFYVFENIKSPTKFKETYRKALDELPLTMDQVTRIVAEANVAFVLNMRLFEELDVQANVPGAVLRPLSDALAYADPHHGANSHSASDQCPFLVRKQQEQQSSSGKRCPWPFIFAHDASQGMRDWQTWLVIGLALAWSWNRLVQMG